jgi:RNA polymerase sigma-70 factor (ECF subfamily)
VSQEAFLKAFRELHRLRDDRAFSGYLYRIRVRLCMDRLRLKRAQPAELEAVQPHEGSSVENRVVIEKVLAQLPYDLRSTLVLREIEQLSYEEVADVMHVPIGTVRSRLARARSALQKALWDQAGEYGLNRAAQPCPDDMDAALPGQRKLRGDSR